MNKRRREALLKFCASLQLEMDDIELLNVALTHTSYAYEAKVKPRPEYNQRLEFLGDSVLSLVVSTYIYDKYTTKDEGYLSKLRAFLVCEGTLAYLANGINLGDYLLLGKGELNLNGEHNPSILADAFEAVIGAYYLAAGLSKVERFLYDVMLKNIDELAKDGLELDYKTRLQEKVQKQGVAEISYEELSAQGPAHAKTFTMRVLINGKEFGTGSGHSKKEAEQQAAKVTLTAINDKDS